MEARRGCAQCGAQEAPFRCGGCRRALYCSAEHQKTHWREGGHRAECAALKKGGTSATVATLAIALSSASAAGAVWPAPAAVLRVPFATLSPEVFDERFNRPCVPVIITGLLDVALVNKAFGSCDAFARLVEGHPLQCRMYGRGHLTRPETWPEAGYVPKVEHVSGHVFSGWVRDGTAQQHDRYIASCDVCRTDAGRLLEPMFQLLSARTGLRVTNFGPQINAWWGAPGHKEGLHCDITDGTLWQLAGLKRVGLFPPAQWQNLYPFSPDDESGKTSWAFCRTTGTPDAAQLAQFPRLAEAMRSKAEGLLSPGEVLYIPAGWAHEVSGEQGDSDHVLSVNRFWHTPMAKTWFLPQEVHDHFRRIMQRQQEQQQLGGANVPVK